jgi:hypothetical protein
MKIVRAHPSATVPFHVELIDQLVELRRVVAMSQPKRLRWRPVPFDVDAALPLPPHLAEERTDDVPQRPSLETPRVSDLYLDVGRSIVVSLYR